MGMYTEIVAGFELREDTPQNVISVLRLMIGADKQPPEDLPEHDLFTKLRWSAIGQSSSYHFGFHHASSSVVLDEQRGSYAVSIRASLKNYDGEIEAFFDWIRPYVDSGSGTRDMIGYSIYEEAAEPILYYMKDEEKVMSEPKLPRLVFRRIRSARQKYTVSIRLTGTLLGTVEHAYLGHDWHAYTVGGLPIGPGENTRREAAEHLR